MTDQSPAKPPSRRRALKLLSGAGASGLGAFALTPARANGYYRGPESDHFDGHRFFNPSGTKPKSFAKLLRMMIATRSASWPAEFPSPHADTPPARVGAGALRITHIGHASFLIQTEGLNILIDPVYAERAGPYGLLGPKRVNRPGIEFSRLPPIDHVLITHNHYDHLDLEAIGKLWQRNRPRLTTPLGNDAIIAGAVAGIAIAAVDWGHTSILSERVQVHTVPTQHWSARGTRDRMHALWASFVIATPAAVVYAIGDTGFGDGSIFRAVRAAHPPIDFALLPIGAYEPRWFMADQHMNPEEAVAALDLCGAKSAAGHHWGTFKLTAEAIDAPRRQLADALSAKGIATEKFRAVQPGEVVSLA